MDYELKDSGEREEFESGCVRDIRTGKGRFDLISPIGLRRLAVIYELGMQKYKERNWEKGMPISRVLDSAERHINQYKEGLREEDHLAQAAWNLFAAMHYEEVIERGLLPKEFMNVPSYLSRVKVDPLVDEEYLDPRVKVLFDKDGSGKFARCEECEESIATIEGKNGDYYCCDCYSRIIEGGVCVNCSERADFISGTGGRYCHDCYKKICATCRNCEKEQEKKYMVYEAGHWICKGCLIERDR